MPYTDNQDENANEPDGFGSVDMLLFEADMCLYFEERSHPERSHEENQQNAMQHFREARE